MKGGLGGIFCTGSLAWYFYAAVLIEVSCCFNIGDQVGAKLTWCEGGKTDWMFDISECFVLQTALHGLFTTRWSCCEGEYVPLSQNNFITWSNFDQHLRTSPLEKWAKNIIRQNNAKANSGKKHISSHLGGEKYGIVPPSRCNNFISGSEVVAYFSQHTLMTKSFSVLS